ncbi:MAG TPA: type VI secretion system contractile sheath large subunit [Rhodopila sp.]|uniref:type VI secretion system contractile sheath large subunit n=1 Tax=Rhodopila sp. TaxID=2480087 RepID=UPI002C87469E|nr:type VI secretion system contractile sheath large subunit [Rhodopila sp.]HVY16442.1 type VI secretion system contractile sheath large subunit [Rhodopila sp.]
MDHESLEPSFADLLERPALVAGVAEDAPSEAGMATMARLVLKAGPGLPEQPARRLVETLIAEIDRAMSAQMNAILHHPAFQDLEAAWRGLWMVARATDEQAGTKIKFLDINKRELSRTLRKFRGNAWDQSPIFRKVYEEEYGQFGGEPYGLLIGNYAFDHRPDDVALLSDIAKIAAAAHVPFVASAEPALLQMESWSETANPRDLTRIFRTPEYVSWRALREQEDSRYVGLCMPRYLARLPYGARTDPLDAFAFEEEAEGCDIRNLLWGNPAFAFACNVVRAFIDYGWCVRIRGVDRGGVVQGLPVLHHPTADGDTDRRTVTEICLSEHREAELSSCGLMPLVHRKNTDSAAFLSAQSLQKPQVYDDPDATINATLSARLPYLFACCRFAHYLKCMVRDKIGSTMSRAEIEQWLSDWLLGYVDGSPSTSSEEFKARHPLADAQVYIEDREDMPGMYEARFLLRPHYQLEGISVALRLLSRMPAQ